VISSSTAAYLSDFLRFRVPIAPQPVLPIAARSMGLSTDVIRRAFLVQQPHYSAVFPASAVDAIRCSVIPNELRLRHGTLPEVHVLALESGFSHALQSSCRRVSELATGHRPTSPAVRNEYRSAFAELSRPLVDEVVEGLHDSSVVAYFPLRSGGFLLDLLPPAYARDRIFPVESKRLVLPDGNVCIALGPASIPSGATEIAVVDAGLVTGLTAITLAQLLCGMSLGEVTRLSVFAVHASWFGIVNVLHAARQLGLDVHVGATFTSYSVNSDLRGAYTLAPSGDILATGDVGDYLSV
jgi:hypothetical protein